MLCSVFNDLVHVMPSLPSQLVSSWTTEIMPPSPVICSLANEHLQKSSRWLSSKCQWAHPWPQNPSGLSRSIRALRCNLRTTSRINKSLPWWQILPFTSSPIKANSPTQSHKCSLMGSLFCLFHLVQARSKQEKMHREPPSTTPGILCVLR